MVRSAASGGSRSNRGAAISSRAEECTSRGEAEEQFPGPRRGPLVSAIELFLTLYRGATSLSLSRFPSSSLEVAGLGKRRSARDRVRAINCLKKFDNALDESFILPQSIFLLSQSRSINGLSEPAGIYVFRTFAIVCLV